MSYRLISVGDPGDAALLDVVFVHGLTGGPFKTWGGISDEPHSPPSITADSTRTFEVASDECMGPDYWPASLASSLSKRAGPGKVNVWSLGYPAPVLKKDDPFAYRESLTTGVRPSVQNLVHGGIGSRSDRGVVFVAHSLGGLVVKAVIADCFHSGDADHQRLLNSTIGVAFVGTPHSGSGLATLVSNLPGLLSGVGKAATVASWLAGTPLIGTATGFVAGFAKWFIEGSNQVQWLETAGSELRVLAEKYRSIAISCGIATRAYYETHPLKHLLPKTFLWIVDASNADPGVAGCLPIGVPYSDHIEICKPRAERRFIGEDVEHWLLQLLKQRQLGVESPVLGEEISAICQSLLRADGRFEGVLKPLPRHLEQIPSKDQLRTDFSHKFRTEVSVRLKGSLGDRLGSTPELVTALERSEWDLDQLILFAWRAEELKVRLQYFLESLKRRTDWIEDQETPEPPTLILTYRAVDSFRDAVVDVLPALRQRFRDAHDWIENRAAADQTFDEDGRTRRLLKDGYDALEKAASWKKPPKALL